MRHFDSTMSKKQSHFIESFTVAFLLFLQVGFSQTNNSIYWQYRITADSIVKHYYGDTISLFITLDSNASFYRTLKTGGGGTMTKFTQPLNFEPEMFSFHYYLKHPLFQGDTLNIKFYINKAHRLMEGFLPEGLFDMEGQKNLKIISKSEALAIAKKSKIKKPLEKYEIELGWQEHDPGLEDYKKFRETKDIKDIVKGRIVWRVKSHFRSTKNPDEKPYSETFVIDAITGDVIGIEHDKFILG